MKYLLLFIIFISCNSKTETHKRYFFIVYDAMSERNHSVGNFFVQEDTMPSMNQLKKDIYDTYKCVYDFSINQYIITNIIEFKDSVDYFRYKKGYNDELGKCDSTTWQDVLNSSEGTIHLEQ